MPANRQFLQQSQSSIVEKIQFWVVIGEEEALEMLKGQGGACWIVRKGVKLPEIAFFQENFYFCQGSVEYY